MSVKRRDFCKLGLAATLAGTATGAASRARAESHPGRVPGESAASSAVNPCRPERRDGTGGSHRPAIGCRKCEEACNNASRLPPPGRPFSDRRVLRQRRRPTPSR